MSKFRSRSVKPESVPLFIPLESVQVASPCHADWNQMQGDEKSRFCGSCAKNVYNLSAMTRAEAETLLLEKEGKLCVRFHQREDGTMLTQDCPIGILRVDERLQPRFGMWANVASLFLLCATLMGGVGLVASMAQAGGSRATQGESAPMMGDVAVAPQPTPKPASHPQVPRVMGRIAVKPKPTPSVPQATMGVVAPPTMGKPIMGAPLPPKNLKPKAVKKNGKQVAKKAIKKSR